MSKVYGLATGIFCQLQFKAFRNTLEEPCAYGVRLYRSPTTRYNWTLVTSAQDAQVAEPRT